MAVVWGVLKGQTKYVLKNFEKIQILKYVGEHARDAESVYTLYASHSSSSS